jgi:predicted DNA-binding protein with PD1-like motif
MVAEAVEAVMHGVPVTVRMDAMMDVQMDVMQVVQDAKVVVTTVCIGVQMDAQIHV